MRLHHMSAIENIHRFHAAVVFQSSCQLKFIRPRVFSLGVKEFVYNGLITPIPYAPTHAHPPPWWICSFTFFFVAGFQVRLFWFEHPLLLHFEDDFWHKLLSINITDWVINWETSNKRQLRLENNFYLKYKLTERDILKLNNDRLYIYSSMCLYFFVIS